MDEYCKQLPQQRQARPIHEEKLARRPWGWCACFFCIVLIGMTTIIGSTGCSRRRAPLPKTHLDSLSYSSVTRDVETLISDSGVTRYKLTSPVWYTYNQPEAQWYFPEGIYLEQFDTLYQIVASVQADTAYYYQSRKLWELKDNVRVLNHSGQRFYAVRLFWDEAKQEIYSHDPIRIEQGEDEMIESEHGFVSNQMMTRYQLFTSRGHMNVKDEPLHPSDSTQSATSTTHLGAAEESQSPQPIDSIPQR